MGPRLHSLKGNQGSVFMTIYEALKKDHEKLKGILEQLVNLKASDRESAKDLIAQVRDELIPHSRAEEAVFYNSIRAVNGAQDVVWHGYGEHIEAETMLRALQVMEKIDADFLALAKKLKHGIEHHITEEESKIFSVAQHLFTNEEAAAMCEAFEEMKPEVKDGSIVQTTLDLVANMLPVRLAAPLRTFTLRENPQSAAKH